MAGVLHGAGDDGDDGITGTRDGDGDGSSKPPRPDDGDARRRGAGFLLSV